MSEWMKSYVVSDMSSETISVREGKNKLKKMKNSTKVENRKSGIRHNRIWL